MVNVIQEAMLKNIAGALDLSPDGLGRVGSSVGERLPSCFPVTEIAVASISAASLALSELIGLNGGAPSVAVDYRLASLWFGFSIVPQGWTMPAPWDTIAGDYQCEDGWIKLHTNAPHHKAAALAVLGCPASRDAVAHAVTNWQADALEQAIVEAGGCAAKLRERTEWKTHPQGKAVEQEALFLSTPARASAAWSWHPSPARPLAGLRVLDLTRVLAGPVATRFLAGFGAEVLRIDPPAWDEPGVIPEVTPGKRCARLDLHAPADRQTFEQLLSKADILVHGYRANALERLGYGADTRQALRPGLIDVSLDAYGHSGPWSQRRGFDSLVQFSSGIAAQGMAWKHAQAPVSLPVQALDHATGYLMAAAAIRGVIARCRGEAPVQYRLSLARTAELLFAHASEPTDKPYGGIIQDDLGSLSEHTSWGPALRVRPPMSIQGAPMRFGRPAAALGSGDAAWGE